MERMPVGLITTIKPDVASTVQKLKNLEISNIQLLNFFGDIQSVDHAKEVGKALSDAGITVNALFTTYENEDYGSIQAGRETGGLVPIESRQSRLDYTKMIADCAVVIGTPAIACHYGTIPESRNDPQYEPIISTAQQICDDCESKGLRLHLETGEDTSETLLGFIYDVNRPSLAVNFDPANMFLYGRGDPITALKAVGAHVKSCHCKDAIPSNQPMVIWGSETPLGEGKVDIEQFVRTLNEVGYDGPLTIEREIKGEQQLIDIRNGKKLLEKIKQKLD